MSDIVRWGVVGTGGIASAFVRDLELLPGHAAVAVGSRSSESAADFGDRHRIPRRHASYAELAADPEVDAVYVATPHPGHHDAALLGIKAGKAVLVEKPFTMDADEARSLVAAARSRGTFLMEAMWTRFLPHIEALRDILASRRLGELVLVTADHGQWFPEDAAFRLFAPELAGGALLDLGIYPVSFASMVLGTPTSVHAVSDPSFTPVDAQTSIVLRHAGGAHASLTTTLRASTPCLASVSGTEGRVEITSTFYRPASFRVVMRDGTVEEHDIPVAGHGMRFEAAEVGRCLREGRTESPLMPLDETVSIMATLDEVRRQIGLEYPPR